jgi:hypothetical protein
MNEELKWQELKELLKLIIENQKTEIELLKSLISNRTESIGTKWKLVGGEATQNKTFEIAEFDTREAALSAAQEHVGTYDLLYLVSPTGKKKLLT